MNKGLFFLIGLLFWSGCKEHPPEKANVINSYQPRYAKLFSIAYTANGKYIYVKNQNNEIQQTYFIGAADKAKGAVVIDNENIRIACLSTSQIAAFDILQNTDKIVAIANEDRLSKPTLYDIFLRNKVAMLGSDFAPNLEKLISSRPTLVFSDGENEPSSLLYNKLQTLQIPVVFSRDYYEKTPLGRAEWIIFFAAFINQEKEAIAYFNMIEKSYSTIKDAVKINASPPKVFCNLPYQQIWYMPCKDNYVTALINDAGGDFIWKNEPATNGLNLQLSFEEVYSKAKDADIWLNVNMAKSLADVRAADERFTHFSAYKNKRIFSPKIMANNAMPIWEYGVFEPNIILSDFVNIFSQYDTSAIPNLHYYHRLP